MPAAHTQPHRFYGLAIRKPDRRTNPKDMRIQTLHALVVIEKLGSIRSAAQQLHMSQPALTAAIRQLEEEVNAPLLVRTTQGVTLTEFGRAFMRHARLIVLESRRAHEEVAQMRGVWEGSLRFATSPAIGLTILPKALRQFSERYPQVKVECRDGLYPGVTPALRDGTLDFALTPVHREEIESDLAAEPLFISDIVIVAPRSHPLAGTTSLADLAECLWVMSSAPRGPGAIIEEAFANHGLQAPRASIVCESFIALPGIVANSNCMATMPRILFENNVFRQFLCIVPVKEALPCLPVCVLRRHDLPLTPAGQQLIGWLQHYALQTRDPLGDSGLDAALLG